MCLTIIIQNPNLAIKSHRISRTPILVIVDKVLLEIKVTLKLTVIIKEVNHKVN